MFTRDGDPRLECSAYFAQKKARIAHPDCILAFSVNVRECSPSLYIYSVRRVLFRSEFNDSRVYKGCAIFQFYCHGLGSVRVGTRDEVGKIRSDLSMLLWRFGETRRGSASYTVSKEYYVKFSQIQSWMRDVCTGS